MQARGEYIQFLDGDDFLLPDKLQKQVDYLNSYSEADIVYCNYSHLFQNKNKTEQYEYFDVSDNPLNHFLFRWDRGVSIPPHAPLFKRSIWSGMELPYPDDYKGRYEDWVFWILVSSKKVNFKRMEESLVVYRIHDHNFCGNPVDVAINRMDAASYIRNIIPEHLKREFWTQSVVFAMESYHKSKSATDVKENFILRLNRKKYMWLKSFIKVLRKF
jgi:glycosyltransferase involved in cell wall biosynthesis